MSDQDFTEVPNDADRWSNVPKDLNQPAAPDDADRWANVPKEPHQPEPVIDPDPFVTVPAPETVFSSEPLPPEAEPVIYDPVTDEREPYARVTPEGEGFASAPPVSPNYSYTPPVEEKKNRGWQKSLHEPEDRNRKSLTK